MKKQQKITRNDRMYIKLNKAADKVQASKKKQ